MQAYSVESKSDSLKNSPDNSPEKSSQEQTHLDRKYGRIGISAVAAALRFQGRLVGYQQPQRASRVAPAATDEAARPSPLAATARF